MPSTRWVWPALLGVVLVLLILRPFAEEGETPSPPEPVAPIHPVSEAEALYEAAIGDLESALDASDAPEELGDLHAAMAPERQAIDAAIAESRRRFAESPDDEAAQGTLLENLRRKLDLFRNTLMLMRDLERGDGATAQDRIRAISGREQPETG